jgi:hypothetical protein
MCRLFAITSKEPLSPMVALDALDVMREGHDCSGVGIFLRDLAGPFDEMKDAPILSGIFSDTGLKRLDTFMMDIGFMTKYKITVKLPKTPPPGVPKRDVYLIRAYEYPEEWEDFSQDQLYAQLLKIRLQLRAMGEEKNDMIVFSFWPDVIMIKEIGDPCQSDHGSGTAEHQLCDYPVCLSSVFHSGIFNHDQRRKYCFCAHSLVFRVSRISRLYWLSIGLRGFYPHPALCGFQTRAWN